MDTVVNPILPALTSKRSLAAFPLGLSSRDGLGMGFGGGLPPALPLVSSHVAAPAPNALTAATGYSTYGHAAFGVQASHDALSLPPAHSAYGHAAFGAHASHDALSLPPAHTAYKPPPELLWDSAVRPRRHHKLLPSHLAHPRSAIGDVFRMHGLLPPPPEHAPPEVHARTPSRSHARDAARPHSSPSSDPIKDYRDAITSLSRASRAFAGGSPLAEAMARYGTPSTSASGEGAVGFAPDGAAPGPFATPTRASAGGRLLSIDEGACGDLELSSSDRQLRSPTKRHLPVTTLAFLLLCCAGLTWSLLLSGGVASIKVNPLFGPTPAAVVATGGRLGYYLVKPRALIDAEKAAAARAAASPVVAPSPSSSPFPSGTVRPSPSATPSRHPTASPTPSTSSSASPSPSEQAAAGSAGTPGPASLLGAAGNATAAAANSTAVAVVTGLQLPTQWWRIMTPVWLHGGFIHLAVNLVALWRLALPAEKFLGPLRMAGLLAATALFGCLVSYVFTPVTFVGSHASVPIMGVAGLCVASIVRRHMAKLPLSGTFEDDAKTVVGPDGEIIVHSCWQRTKTSCLELLCLSSAARKRRSRARQSRRSARLSTGSGSGTTLSTGSAAGRPRPILGAEVGPLDVTIASVPVLLVSLAPMVDLWASLGGLISGFLLGLSELNAAPSTTPGKLQRAVNKMCTRARVRLCGYSERDHAAAVRASISSASASPGARRSLARRPAFASESSRSIPRREGLCSFIAVYGGLAGFFILFALAFLAVVQDVNVAAGVCPACANISCAPLDAWVCEPAAAPWIVPTPTPLAAAAEVTAPQLEPLASPSPAPSPVRRALGVAAASPRARPPT